jgi:hypothetical protein
MHAGEVYISKAELSPSVTDLQHCVGDEDPRCIAGAESYTDAPMDEDGGESLRNERWAGYKEMWAVLRDIDYGNCSSRIEIISGGWDSASREAIQVTGTESTRILRQGVVTVFLGEGNNSGLSLSVAR